MPNFVLNRNYTMAGKGHMIGFTKGQPTWVPPELTKEAVGIGAECIDEKIDVLGPEESVPEPLTMQEKESLMFTAFELLTERNEREDFEGSGKPAMDALKKIVEFNFTKKERDKWFQDFRASKAAEQA